MGCCCEPLMRRLYPCNLGSDRRVVILGLDGAGKTTILYKLIRGLTKEPIPTEPTMGFNVETYVHKKKQFALWDVGGIEKLRAIWRYYYQNTVGIIYVIDASDEQRFEEAKRELRTVLEHPELEGVPLLVFANKQDLPGAMDSKEVEDKLDLDNMEYPNTSDSEDRHLTMDATKRRKWRVMACSAYNKGKGLLDGFDWLTPEVYPSYN